MDQPMRQGGTAPTPAQARVDIHIHLAGSGCHGSGCWLSPALRRRYTIRLLQLAHRISDHMLDHDLDDLWPVRIHQLLKDSPLDYGVILGFDGATSANGEIDLQRSQLIIPPAWVFALCRQYANFLPGPSINPHRQDALDLLAYCIEQKAVLIKWLPSAQLIDPSARSLQPFYQRLADAGIPLLVHCGGEKTFHSLDPALNQVALLEQPLSYVVKVIVAHSATRVLGQRSDPDQLPQLKSMLARHPNLWLDNSGLCNPSRFAHVPRLARDELITSRTLYGSDWPVPSNAIYYLKALGWRETMRLERIENWLERDLAIKQHFGYPPETLTRASQVLANLEAWTGAKRPS